MPPAQKNATGKDEYVYSDDSFDESYHSDGDIGRNNRRGAASSTLSKSPAPRTNFNSHITSANSYIHPNTNYRSYNFKSNTNNKGKKRKNSQLSFLPPNVKDDTLRQWCHEQITRRKTLQNKIGELSRRLEELTEENRDLRKQVRFGEKSLQKMERDQKNMPFVLREHSADIRRLRKNMDEEHKSKEDLEKRNKKISEELVRMRDENRDLKRIINDKDLMKKQYERGMFEDLESKAQLAEENNKKREDDFRNMEKNHKSEVNRLNIKVRNLTSEKEDLENAMKELESKLQEKDKELAIHYIYAQRLTKPPPRLSNTPPKVLTNKHVMTDPDSVLEGVKRDNLLLKQEVHNLRGQLEKFGATAKFLDEEKEKLEKEQQERERKEREFQEEMEKSRQAAEAEEKRRREELEAEAEQDRIRREEEAERKKIEEQDRVERERIEWEKTQRRKIEEEVIREIKTHYQRRLQQVDGQIVSQLKDKKKDEISKIGGTGGGTGGLVSKTTGRERGANCQHSYQPALGQNNKSKTCQRCERRQSGATVPPVGGKTGSRVGADSETTTKTSGGGRRSQEGTTAEQIEEH